MLTVHGSTRVGLPHRSLSRPCRSHEYSIITPTHSFVQNPTESMSSIYCFIDDYYRLVCWVYLVLLSQHRFQLFYFLVDLFFGPHCKTPPICLRYQIDLTPQLLPSLGCSAQLTRSIRRLASMRRSLHHSSLKPH